MSELVKICTIAHVLPQFAQAWMQHLRDFDTAHPGCHFEVLADAPDEKQNEEWSCGHVAGAVCQECYRNLAVRAHELAEVNLRLRSMLEQERLRDLLAALLVVTRFAVQLHDSLLSEEQHAVVADVVEAGS